MVDAARFYDDFADAQQDVGVTSRHHAIIAALRDAGWRRGHRVLEIGCGVGTLTELLVRGLGRDGSLVATDLSPRSVEFAKQRLGERDHLRLLAGNVLELELDERFDVVVLPDVIEHIPLALHRELFQRVSSWLAPEGFVVLNYPNPLYLEWCRTNRPELLQVVDQPVHADVLLANAYSASLYLESLRTYSVWIRQGDYVVAVLRPHPAVLAFDELPNSISRRVRRHVENVVAGRLWSRR